jgi:predicted nucleic acid-binding protein
MDENARILVDTSVWIDFLNGEEQAVSALAALIKTRRIVICGQIKQEVLQGSRDGKAFAKLEKEMAIWEYEAEEPHDFVEAAHIFSQLRWKGITVPPSDCLIAAVAKRRKLPVYARDTDFNDIPQIRHYQP